MLRRATVITTLTVAMMAARAAPAAPADRVVAIAPLSTLGTEDTSASTKTLTAQIEAAVTGLGGTKIISTAQVTDAVKKARKPQLNACEGELTCLVELGKLVGAQIVIAGEIGGLGESRIVYLGATDVAAGKELRSTTLAIGTKEDASSAQGAVIRLLDPDRYRGSLHFAIDVTGATVFVNGGKVALTPKGDLALPVGTQAVRVTHPEYHDFVRFIDVTFNTTTDVAVGMQQYPIIQRDIQGNPINRDQLMYVDPPLWRRWYVVGPAAVGLAIVTGIIVSAIASESFDLPCRKVGGEPCN